MEKCLKEIFQKEISKDFSVEFEENSQKGNGYLGEILFAKIRGKTENNLLKSFECVIKSSNKSKKVRDEIPIREAFENEIFMYNEILPLFHQFQLNCEIDNIFDNAPKYFGTSIMNETEVIVLENLKAQNYYLWDRMKPMDLEHIKTVLETYGKFHAISFALKNVNIDLFNGLEQKFRDVLGSFGAILKKNSFDPFKDVIEALEQSKDFCLARKVDAFSQERIKRQNLPKIDEYSVILHGDCWNNNFLFKRVVGELRVCILDWQFSRVASPVFDLSYFLFTTMSPEDFHENFHSVLNHYYASLSCFLLKFGSNATSVYPYQVFLEHWKRYSHFSILKIPSVIRLCLVTNEEAPNLTEILENGGDLWDLFRQKIQNKEEYLRRVCGVVRFVLDSELIGLK